MQFSECEGGMALRRDTGGKHHFLNQKSSYQYGPWLRLLTQSLCVSGANNLKIFYLPKPQATMTGAQLLLTAKMGGTNGLKISTFQARVCKPI